MAAAIVLVLAGPSVSRAQRAAVPSLFKSSHPGGPIDITGQTFVYDYKSDRFVVSGNAIVTQAHTVLTADQVDLMRREHKMRASGNVHLVDPLGNVTARDAVINTTDETADLTDATVTDKQETYRLEGAHIRKLLGQRYAVLDGFFTTCGCEPGTPDWSITAERMDVHLGDTGTAHHGHFNILGYPIIPLPYAVFPTDTDRHSGLLGPRIGISGMRGFQFVQPYYWAINKSSDATVALDVETSKRVGMLAEYRLISGKDDYFSLDGSFYDESPRTDHSRVHDVVDTQIADPHIPLDRYDIIAMARQHLTDDLVVYGDAVSVSDSLFLREMNVWTLSRTIGSGIMYPHDFPSMRDAQSDFGLLDSYNGGFVRLQGNWNQDLIQPQPFALQTLPDLLVSGRKDLPGGLAYSDYDFEGTNFWRSRGQSGLRVDFDPRVTIPWRLSDYLYGFGTLGLRETIYQTSGHQISVTQVGTTALQQFNNSLALGPLADGGFQSREMIYGAAGIGTELERVYDLEWKSIEKLKNTIEPFATYSYVPQVYQKNLPLFDEVDRMEARSLITYGFTSRLFAKTVAQPQGPEGQGQDDTVFDSALSPYRAHTVGSGGAVEELLRFTALQAYDVTHAIAPGASRFSDLDFNTVVFPTRVWSFGSQLGFDPSADQLSYANAYLNFQPWWTRNQAAVYQGKAEQGSFLQVSYNYIAPGPAFARGLNANFSQFVVLRAYYDIFDRMGVYFAPSYDFVNHKLLSSAYGVRLKSPCDCWSFDAGVTKTHNPSETQFQFQLTLGGIGSVGESPFGRNPFQLHNSVFPVQGY